eukprot:1141233-Pelagomonas_calceolata.AAC.2
MSRLDWYREDVHGPCAFAPCLNRWMTPVSSIGLDQVMVPWDMWPRPAGLVSLTACFSRIARTRFSRIARTRILFPAELRQYFACMCHFIA